MVKLMVALNTATGMERVHLHISESSFHNLVKVNNTDVKRIDVTDENGNTYSFSVKDVLYWKASPE